MISSLSSDSDRRAARHIQSERAHLGKGVVHVACVPKILCSAEASEARCLRLRPSRSSVRPACSGEGIQTGPGTEGVSVTYTHTLAPQRSLTLSVPKSGQA